jgi:hypothetical protein
MPRQVRLDAAGVLHHVMTRGIEQRLIFWDDRDRENFIIRMSELASKQAKKMGKGRFYLEEKMLILKADIEGQ